MKIAIDFEYCSDGLYQIKHLICAAVTCENGRTATFWLRDGSDTLKLTNALLAHKNDVFVCHALDLAESQCFRKLGLDPLQFRWRDTQHECRALSNRFGSVWPGCSLVECCKTYLNINIDKLVKEEMRGYCIADATAGHETDIMAYCLEDTAHLLALADATQYWYEQHYNTCYCPYPMVFPASEVFEHDARVILQFQEIAQRGLPVNAERLDAVARKAPAYIYQKQREFADKYPGTFICVKGHEMDMKMDRKVCQRRFSEQLRTDGLLYTWPKSSDGGPSMDSKVMGKVYSRTQGFAGDYLHLQNSITQLRGIAKGWISNLDRETGRMMYRSLRPYGTSTGRCTPKPGDGFIPGWAHWLYGVLEPPKGKWLVELDFSAEETAIMARLTRDEAYAEVYGAKDTYLWYCDKLGLIPHEDFVGLPKDVLKEKYHEIRRTIKTFALAWGYGAGADKLASTADIPLSKAKEFKAALDYTIFSRAHAYQDELKDLFYNGVSKEKSCIGVPDGWIVVTHNRDRVCSGGSNPIINWPFQAFGAYILRRLVSRLYDMRIEVCATIHDAILFLVDEGDMDTIERVSSAMQTTADDALRIPADKRPFVKVGSPDIIKHGEVWGPEQKDIDKFNAYMSA